MRKYEQWYGLYRCNCISVHSILFIFQPQTSGLYQLFAETSHQDALLMVLCAMVHGSWCLEVWQSMANTPMSFTSCKLADGSGGDWNPNHQRIIQCLAQDSVCLCRAILFSIGIWYIYGADLLLHLQAWSETIDDIADCFLPHKQNNWKL